AIYIDDNAPRTDWLVFPSTGPFEAWEKLDASQGAVRVPEDMARIEGEYPNQVVRFSDPAGGQWLEVHRATLPDFSRYYDASVMNPKVLVGVFLGAMSVFVFCAMTMKAVGRAAKGMV